MVGFLRTVIFKIQLINCIVVLLAYLDDFQGKVRVSVEYTLDISASRS